MKSFRTEKRIRKITSAVKSRQFSLRLIIENVWDPHNVSAIFRTCDAAGIPKITLLYTIEKFPKIRMTSSSSARKWIETERFNDAKECFSSLKKEGFKIYATTLDKDSKNIYDIDFTEKCAVLLGNENRGASGEAINLADETIYIPMYGMIQSLNVSVAAAVILYEAQRQRASKGMYGRSELPNNEINRLIEEWSRK